jgi:hypothetical protein
MAKYIALDELRGATGQPRGETTDCITMRILQEMFMIDVRRQREQNPKN